MGRIQIPLFEEEGIRHYFYKIDHLYFLSELINHL